MQQPSSALKADRCTLVPPSRRCCECTDAQQRYASSCSLAAMHKNQSVQALSPLANPYFPCSVMILCLSFPAELNKRLFNEIQDCSLGAKQISNQFKHYLASSPSPSCAASASECPEFQCPFWPFFALAQQLQDSQKRNNFCMKKNPLCHLHPPAPVPLTVRFAKFAPPLEIVEMG